ncbi:MAG: hypothetical protein ACRDQ0_15850 [Pseudonocardia sp.]
MTAPAVPPARDLSPDARRARYHAELRARNLARRAVWHAARRDPDRYRALMALWLGIPPGEERALERHPPGT